MALRNSPKEDLKGFTPNDFVLGQPIRRPGKFFDGNTDTGISGDPNSIVRKFGHYVTSLRFMPPRKNKSHIWKKLFSCQKPLMFTCETTVIDTLCNLHIKPLLKLSVRTQNSSSSTCVAA